MLRKGTMELRAERIVVRQDADGFVLASATGAQVHFRQKSDPRGSQEGVWVEAHAFRVEVDEKNERVELYESAQVSREKDEVRGSYILYDQRSEFFSVSSGKGAAGSRVTATIQPKKPEAPAPAPAPRKPEARK